MSEYYHKTNVTLDRRSMRKIKRLNLDLEDKYDFPIALKESYAVNATLELVLRAADSEMLEERARELELNEEETKRLKESYEWFLNEYVDLISKIVNERIAADERRRNGKNVDE